MDKIKNSLVFLIHKYVNKNDKRMTLIIEER